MPKRINEWARQYPNRVFGDDFAQQRKYLDDETWDYVVKNNTIKAGSREYNMLPAKYRSSIYNNELGQKRSDFGNTIAEGITEAASYTPVLGDAIDATRAGMDFKHGNNLAGAIGVGSLLLPNMLEKPIKTLGKILQPGKTLERINNIRQIAKTNIADANEDISNLRNLYKRGAYIPNTGVGRSSKQKFIADNRVELQNYRKQLNSEVSTTLNNPENRSLFYGEAVGTHPKFDEWSREPSIRQYRNHPNYLEYALEMKADPNNPRTAAGFISRQRKSIRGVVSPNEESAKKMLLDVQGDRSGGDMLGTGGGLYTSNSFDVADAFSNNNDSSKPLVENGKGYIGYIKNNLTYDPSKSILDNLNSYKNRLGTSGNKKEMIVSQYGGTEKTSQRVYTKDMGLSLYKTIVKDNIENKGGRFGHSALVDKNLFIRDYPGLTSEAIAKQRSNASMRLGFRGIKPPETESYIAPIKDYMEKSTTQRMTRRSTFNKTRLDKIEDVYKNWDDRYNTIKNIDGESIMVGTGAAGALTTPYLFGKLGRWQRENSVRDETSERKRELEEYRKNRNK